MKKKREFVIFLKCSMGHSSKSWGLMNMDTCIHVDDMYARAWEAHGKGHMVTWVYGVGFV